MNNIEYHLQNYHYFAGIDNELSSYSFWCWIMGLNDTLEIMTAKPYNMTHPWIPSLGRPLGGINDIKC